MVHASFQETVLGEILDFYNGKSVKPGGEGKYPVYGSNGIIGYSDEYKYSNALIIGRVGAYCGSIEYCKSYFWASDNTIVTKPKDETHDVTFLYYLLKELNLNRHAGGAAQPLITQGTLKQVTANVPPLPTQRKIASILSAYDDLIENNTRRIKILEEMAQMIYREWFVKFRFPGHEKVKMVDSAMEWIPKGWEVGTLGKMAKVLPGYAFKSKDWRDVGIPVIKIKNITEDGTIDTRETDFVSEDIITGNLRKFLLMNGDILIAMTGATAGKVGRVRTKSAMALNQRVAKISPLPLNEAYVWLIISSDEARKLLFGLADGAAQPNMSGAQIENIKILIPMNCVLDQFNKVVMPMIQHVDVLCLRNENLRQTRDLLLPKLISGAVDVEKITIGGNDR